MSVDIVHASTEKPLALFRDPDVSFLLGRLLCVEFGFGTYKIALYGICDYYIKVAIANPQVIEWESLRRLFYFGFMIRPGNSFNNNIDRIMR